MKKLIYFFEFIFIYIFFIFFKILGYRSSSNLGFIIGKIFGPIFRSKKLIINNLKKSNITLKQTHLKVANNVLGNYGRIFAEYPFLKKFRTNELNKFIDIDGKEYLEKIKSEKKSVVFVSGHFNNFELMAMFLDNAGVKISAIYRPLNNIFLNQIIEGIRKKYICKNQIKKGIGGLKKLITLKKNNLSTAIMIDQRVSEGILSDFFNHKASTTSIPAELVKKFNIDIVPVYIERIEGINFKIKIYKPLNFNEESSVQNITDKLNQILETMIVKKPEQWIWSHNRWK